MFNTLRILHCLYTSENKLGAVRMTTCHFSKVCDRSTFANLGGNANVQQAHGGAAILENLDIWTQVKFSYFYLTLSTLFTNDSNLNAIPNELSCGALRCPTYFSGIIE